MKLEEAIKASLTPDLLDKKYKDNPLAHCYVASEAAYHMMGGPSSGWKPMNMKVGDTQHWWLQHPEHGIMDLTHEQFEEPVDHSLGVGRGFLTKQPSKRAQTVIDKATGLMDSDNFRETSFNYRTAAWPDIQDKAKRLVLNGNVTLHRNGANNVVGTVVGDHGTYRVEIGRDDPNSRAISTWTCECPWDQFAWDRTRIWKKYEGRVCSHTLAAFWKALATPLDDDADTTEGPAPGLQAPPDQPFDQKQFTPDEQTNVAPPQFGALPQVTTPDSGWMEQFQQRFPMLSKVDWEVVGAADDFDRIHEMIYPSQPGKKSVQPNVLVTNQDGVWGELRGGKIPMPDAQPATDEFGSTLYHAEGHPVYHWQHMGYDPETGTQAYPPSSGPEERGRHGRIPPGSTAAVLDTNPHTRQVAIVYYTNGYKLHPHLIKSWVDAKDVRYLKNTQPPHRQRRR